MGSVDGASSLGGDTGVRMGETTGWRARVRLLPVGLLVVALVVGLVGVSPARAEEPVLGRGSEGPTVGDLQQRLKAVGLYRGLIDGVYGPQTAQAVMAFHKHLGLERSFEFEASDWRYLNAFRAPEALPEDQIVVDLDRQLLYLHQQGRVAIIPVSSASGEAYRSRGGRWVRSWTPEGTFRLQRHIDGMRRSYLGALWRPWYFSGGYAIHGSPSVPAHPASHGCVRVPNWEADWLAGRLELGMQVTIGRGGEAEPPQLPARTPSALVRTPAGGAVTPDGYRVG